MEESLPQVPLIEPPIAAIEATTTTGIAPLTVGFDGSKSQGCVTGYSWDFGDGTAGSDKAKVEHTFVNSGTYTVTLSVVCLKHNYFSEDFTTVDITVTEAPLIASFVATPATGPAPLTVCFDASKSQGKITDYSWDFGDNTRGSGPNPCHTYATAGSYTVTLTIVDAGGASSLAQGTITVYMPLTACFTYTSDPFRGPLTVDFDASCSSDPNPGGKITSYSWDFGDGQSNSSPDTFNTYTAAGSYTVKLTVTDNFNLQGSSTQTISVPLQTVPSS